MSIMIDDSKRTAIACKLADIREVQNLLISNEEKLISACSDQDIRDQLGSMLKDDQKNLAILDTVSVQYGVQGKPRQTVTMMVEKVNELMDGAELSLYEKAAQHELLKHEQFMSGVLIHKAAQVVGADVEAAITPLNTVNFENRAHQEQLKGVLEVLGVRELTGQEAEQGLWARVQDSVAALSGVIGSAVTQASDKSDMSILDVIRMDHNKVNMLFMQIENSNDPQKIEEFFGQIYRDLSIHSEAEEQIVYPAIQSFYSETENLYEDQAEMKSLLEQLKASNVLANDFLANIEHLKTAVTAHVTQEETSVFTAIRKNCSDEQQEHLATQFKAAKKKLQEQSAAKTA